MQAISLAQAKAHLSEVLNTVESGVDVVITRHGRPVAKVVSLTPQKQPLPFARLAQLRQRTPAWNGSSADSLRALREAE